MANMIYDKMGNLGRFFGGLTGKKKDDFVDGNVHFITYKNIYSNIEVDLSTEETVKIGANENQRTLKYGDVIFTGSSENREECALSSVVTKELKEDYYLNSFCFIWRLNNNSIYNPHFLKYLFRSPSIRTQLMKTANGVTRYNVSKKEMEKVVVPIPSIEEQNRIVKILDEYTEKKKSIIEKLSRETKINNQLYDYYKNLLFKMNLSIKYQTLEEVCDIYDCLHETPKYSNDGYSIIRITDIKNKFIGNETLKVTEETYNHFIKRYKPKKNDLVVSRVGSYGRFSIIPEDNKFCMGQNTVVLSPKINYEFLYYYLNGNSIQQFISENVNGSSQKTLSLATIRKILIPVLDAEEMSIRTQKISSLEYNFKKLNNSILKEIELVEKQYQYYMEKLLSFNN